MNRYYKITDIETYCRTFGFAYRNPLISVVECEDAEAVKNVSINWGLYALYIKNTQSCKIIYGRTHYDHRGQTVIAFAPGQTSTFESEGEIDPSFIGLVFHPDLLVGTSLASKIRRYTFFNYESNEALHLSESEQSIILNLMNQIRQELRQPTDQYSKDILISGIEMLLDYCLRYYKRQFESRKEINNSILAKFENLLNDYIFNGKGMRNGTPSVAYFANECCLSSNYFGDLIKKETGVPAKDFIQQKMIDYAKEQLIHDTATIETVGATLGFQYSQHFIRFFKRQTGKTPREYISEVEKIP